MRKDEFPLIESYADSKVNEVLNKIRAEIDKARFIDKDTRICKNALASGLEVAMDIIDKYKGESEENETWNGIHAQITAPKGTFERIFNDAEDDTDI